MKAVLRLKRQRVWLWASERLIIFSSVVRSRIGYRTQSDSRKMSIGTFPGVRMPSVGLAHLSILSTVVEDIWTVEHTHPWVFISRNGYNLYKCNLLKVRQIKK